MTVKNSYTKLHSGDWGVRVEGAPVSDGQSVTVTKKDGSTKTEIIRRVLWTGGGVSLCAISSGNGHSSSSGVRSRGSGTCVHCGDACGAGYRTCVDCAHGGQSYYDRNGNFVLGSDD